ncbi:MAG: helix-turn-helix transcriptional regulator [Proteobacteria bacterium]|nr:helix-turn-helix transcriptional regulator [Pseudomonadota bacterium]
MISEKLRAAIRDSGLRHYQIAGFCGLHFTTFSRLINGIEGGQPGDRRVIAIGRFLGVPAEECFEEPLKGGNGDEATNSSDCGTIESNCIP